MDHHEGADPDDDIPDPDPDHGSGDDPAGEPGNAAAGEPGNAAVEPSGSEQPVPEFSDVDSPILDEAFIASATIHEPSASERFDGPGPYGMSTGPGGGIGSGFEPTRVFITTSRSQPVDDDWVDEPGVADGVDHDDYHDGPFDAEDEFLHRRSLRRRRRRGRIVKALALLVVLATFAVYGLDHFVTGIQLLPWTRVNRALSGNEAPTGATALSPPDDDPSDDASEEPEESQEQVRIIRGENWPPAPQNPSTERVLPVVIASTSGPHEFIMTQDDGSGPIAYDPCRPIPYVISGASKAPLEGRQLIEESIAEVTRATGLAFVDEGVTTERPSDKRRSYQPNRYGARWAPVLIAWSDPTESPRLAESPPELDTPEMDILGYAGSNAVGLRTVESKDSGSNGETADPDMDQMIYVTGSVTLDGPDFASLLQTPGGYEIARAAIMHEFAHLVGLAHIDDPSQLMFPSLQPNVREFAGGDLEGLAALGAGRCMPEI